MAIPKYFETFEPTLKVLSNGASILRRDVPNRILEDGLWSLTDEEKSAKVESGQLHFHNRVGWGISYLKRARMVYQPSRGYVAITEKGKKLLESGKKPTLDLLMSDPDWELYEPRIRIKNNEEIGDIDQFTPQELVEKGIIELSNNLRSELKDKLYTVDPYYFQSVILVLFQKMGYGDFIETPKSGDGGVDGIINEDQLGIEKIYIQAKRYKDGNKVREPDIRNFIGAMSGDVRKGIFVTTSSFDNGAITKAQNDRNHTIILVDGDKLVELMIKFGIGVQIQKSYEVKTIDEDFFNEEI